MAFPNLIFVFFIFLNFAHIVVRHQVTAQQNRCRTPNQEVGECVSLKFCPEVVNLFTKFTQNHAKEYSQALHHSCGRQKTLDNYPIVCCTRVIDEVVTTSTEKTTMAPKERSGSSFVYPMTNSPDCQDSDGVIGYCKYLGNCTVLLNRAINKPDDENFKAYLRESNKLCNSVHGHVCCPIATEPTTKPATRLNSNESPFTTESEGCGLVRVQTLKVVGGVSSQIGAWPWIALIGYNAFSMVPFKCGGTLVSARHVITAAHCIRSDLSFVRLGEHDLSEQTETNTLDVNVKRVERHPNFGRDGRNDLAILFLEQSVRFTESIVPICMPTSVQLRTKSYVGNQPFVAGWGRTMEGGSSSNVLQQLQIPVLENSECKQIYARNGRLITEQQFDESVLCAGHLVGGQDTCQGDSGGPLMMPELYKGVARYYLIGIISYGIGCARVGIPGAYTSTQYFIDWIAEKMADT